MQRAAAANENVHWEIKSAPAGGLVWLVWEGPDRKLALNLGSKNEAMSALADWLRSNGLKVQESRPSKLASASWEDWEA